MGQTRRWLVIAVVAAMLAGCGEAAGTGDGQTFGATSGDAAFFCRAWPEARAALSGESTVDRIGDQSIDIESEWDYASRYLASIDPIVPAEIRAEWDLAYEYYTDVSGMFAAAGYNDGAIHPVHLAMAFGDTGPEAATAEAEAAIAAIEAWSIQACGDFCSRWSELGFILQFHEPGQWHELERNIDRYEGSLDAGDLLVPAEIAAPWDSAAEAVRDTFAFARDLGFRPDQVGDDPEETFAERVGRRWDEVHEVIDESRDRISGWAEANCEATATVAGGAPGSVTIRMTPQDGLIGRMVLLALLPTGTSFATLRSNESFIAVACADTDIGPEEWQRFVAEVAPQAPEQGMTPEEFAYGQLGEHLERRLAPTRATGEYTQPLCSLMEHEEEALVPAGTYELFVGTYIGDPGSYGVYMAAPERCAQIPVTVSGDTLVELPQLTECSMEAIGSVEEIARRPAPPADAAGSLSLRLDSALRPDGYAYCHLLAVALPAGTTLNAIGRGDAWPSAIIHFGRPSASEIEEEARQRAYSSGLVPLLQASFSGSGETWLGPNIHPNGPWDDRFPDPVPLLSGSYDVRVEQLCIENEGDWDEQAEREGRRCAMVTVEVDGATIVEMPELGACP